MATSAELVTQQFERAKTYADNAISQVNAFSSQLNTTFFNAPTISVAWNDLAPPTLPSMPSDPQAPEIGFAAPMLPTPLELNSPTITPLAFTEIAPTLTIPTAPTVSYGVAPTIPSVGAVSIPTAPTLSTVATPNYLALSTPTFAGVDLRPDLQAQLTTIPTLNLVAPTPYSYAVNTGYSSTLLSSLNATVNARMAGGTGLNATVEQAIWDRARTREINIALTDEAEIDRTNDALGFQLPPGVIAAQKRQTQRLYYDKLSSLSRDIAIKQADMEQENLKQTIDMGINLEGKLIDRAMQMERLSFENAKNYADNAIQVYNSQVSGYSALLQGYQTFAAGYKTIIDGELSKVEVYKAQLVGEQAKADVNNSLVNQFKAQIDAGLAQVQIFQAQVGAANALVQLEQTKISAAGEQIKGYIASINAETAKVEAFKAQVQAEATKVDIYKTKADAFASVAGAAAEQSRLELGVYNAKLEAKKNEYESYRAQVDAERSRMEALAKQSEAIWNGFRAKVQSIEASSAAITKVWESNIRKYQAVQELSVQTAKYNNDAFLATRQARLDATRAGLQTYSQLCASAYSMVNASAGISASGGTSVSYSYSNETSSKAPMTAII